MRCLVVNKVWDYLKKEQYFKKYAILTLTLFIASINFNLFMNPLHIVAGGTNGISILIEELFSISPAFFIFIFSVVVLLLSFIFLGPSKTSSAIVATFLYPLFVKLTSDVSFLLNVNIMDKLFISIIVGIITGWVSGTICKIGMSQGGVILIGQIMYEKFRISISKVNFLINFVVVIIGGFSFGFATVLYAIIVLYVNSIVLNHTLLGISKNKEIYLITEKQTEIEQYFLQELNREFTYFDTFGIDGEKRMMLFSVIPNGMYYRITSYIKKIDPNAFCVVVDAYQTAENN